MCGIVGIGGPRGRDLVERSVGSLAHRGPDDEGIWSDAEFALGHRRLTIIGLDPAGCQPRQSENGNSVLAFNGEIYNYLELADALEAEGRQVDRRFDTAVLLEALETWGLDVLPRLNGMFAFAWYHKTSHRIVLARDRWGKKPLFWGALRLGDGAPSLVFASELRVFTQLPGGPPPPDPLGVARYLAYDGMPDRRTVYRGVEKVPAATWIELDTEGSIHRQSTYWELGDERLDLTAAEAEERFEAALERSLMLRLRSDVPVGLFLSGGIDSSLLASTWRRLQPDGKLTTFTVGFEDASYDERLPARQMAAAVDSDHHEVLIAGTDLERELDSVWQHLSEPFADPSILPVSALCRFARRHVTVALGGDGADELQAGYDPFRAWATARRLERVFGRRGSHSLVRGIERLLPIDARNMSIRFKAHHFAQGLLHPPDERVQAWMAGFPPLEALEIMHPDLAASVDVEEILEPSRRAFRAHQEQGDLRAQIGTWIKTYLECSILTKVDRASMMHSLEVRAPFLDPDLATLLLGLPDPLVLERGRGKVLMRRVAARRIPAELADRRKKGLGVPQATWLRTVLRQRMEDCLETSRNDGWFRHRAVADLWAEHLDERADHRRALWTFLFSYPFRSG